MKLFRLTTLLVALIAITAPILAADVGIRAGRYNDSSEEFVGAEAVFDLGAINVNPNIEYWLVDDITAGSANIDLTLDVARLGAAVPYVGAGLGLLYIDDEVIEAHTDLVGNLIGGVVFDLGRLKPYAQFKYFSVLDDEETETADELALTIGLRF